MNNISIQHLFADLEDPRQASKVKHRVQDIVVLAILAVISNAQWVEIAEFGEGKAAWLKQYLALGIRGTSRVEALAQHFHTSKRTISRQLLALVGLYPCGQAEAAH